VVGADPGRRLNPAAARAVDLDVVVVGAGPAGLVLTRRLAKTGLVFEVFERNDDVGGIWDIETPNSPMYESAHFISSRTLSGFDDFPMPDTYPDYPDHRQILAYIRSFADAYDLRRHITFRTGVVHAGRNEDGTWTVELSDGSTRTSRALICANGVTWEPNIVTWPGQDGFEGEIRHSVTYTSATEFRGKRVLVVGAGNSGVDIACDAAFAADAAFISLRRGYYFVPKHIFGQPSDVFASSGPHLPMRAQQLLFTVLLRVLNGKPNQYGLPKPDHRILESHPIMNTQLLHYLSHGDITAKADVVGFDGPRVRFADGTTETVDLVITATGYHHAAPYLDADVLPMREGRPDLYLGMFPRTIDNLYVLGFVEFASAAYSNFDAMAELIVADVAAPENSPTRRTLRDLRRNHHPDLTGGTRYVRSERHANYVEVDTYLKVLRDVRDQIATT
jgi:hypothetical protein